MSDLAAVAFRRYYDDLFRFVRRRSRSTDDAEEITQAVFVQAAEQLAVRPAPGSLSAWLYTVARNRLIDEARRRSRRGELAVFVEATVAARPSRYGGEVAVALREALAGLPESQRQVVVLRLLEGRSFAEIAVAVSANEAACKMRFVRGLAEVRDVFEQKGITP
jgi:RNA polymerase sigma-70 factor (ECF subfamily)